MSNEKCDHSEAYPFGIAVTDTKLIVIVYCGDCDLYIPVVGQIFEEDK